MKLFHIFSLFIFKMIHMYKPFGKFRIFMIKLSDSVSIFFGFILAISFRPGCNDNYFFISFIQSPLNRYLITASAIQILFSLHYNRL